MSVPVTHYKPTQALILNYVLQEQMSSLLNGAFFGCGYECGILGVSIYYYKHLVVPLTYG